MVTAIGCGRTKFDSPAEAAGTDAVSRPSHPDRTAIPVTRTILRQIEHMVGRSGVQAPVEAEVIT